MRSFLVEKLSAEAAQFSSSAVTQKPIEFKKIKITNIEKVVESIETFQPS